MARERLLVDHLNQSSIVARLEAMAHEYPDRPAVAFPSAELTYGEVDARSAQVASALRALGVGFGDRVGILLRAASPDYVLLLLGILRLGAICVPVNARNKVRELAYVVAHSEMRLLLSETEFAPIIERAGLPGSTRTQLVDVDPLPLPAGPGLAPVSREPPLTRTDLALLLYTSGTTGDPKGCLHSHGTLLSEGDNCSAHLRVTSVDRFWTPLPLFHVGGWQVLMTTLARGACFSHVASFDSTVALEQIDREPVTILFPAFELIWNQVLGHPRFPEADFSSVRVIMNVGTPERLDQMQATLAHARQISCYGSTESCGSICLGDPWNDSAYSRSHSSGRPLPGVEMRIVDPDTRRACGVGEPGEVEFRGPTRFVGYYRDPDATATALDSEGWFHSGDLMVWNADGTITFVGRLKDMLKVGGENVSAAEVEGFLVTHPAVAVAVVVGVPDGRYGEVPAAFVQLASGEEFSEQDMISFCVGMIATYKVPRYLRVVETFPVSASEKIQKFRLRGQLTDELARLGATQAPRIASR
jgi:fatty-acyl-CoA synthase